MNKTLDEIPGEEKLKDILEQVASDRSRGSREITAFLLEELLVWCLELAESPGSRAIEKICREIVSLRPEMAAVTNFGYLLWDRFSGQKMENVDKNFCSALRELRARLEKADENIINAAKKANLNDHDVMSFSRSSTVLKLMLNSTNIEKSVVLHSYPGGEGIDLAEDLTEEIDVTFAYDVEAGYFLPKVDALYMGADVLFEDGSVVNKTGSRLLARSSAETPVRVVTDVWKLADGEVLSEVPRFPSPEVLPEKLKRNHPIFESVPGHLIDTYITNMGVFESLDKLLESTKELQKAREKFCN